jgi:serine/threonine-protein kinase
MMPGNPQVFGLLEEMLDCGKTPQEVCRDCPELLPEVQQRWEEFQLIDAQVRTLLPGLGAAADATAVTTAPLAPSPPRVPGYEVEAVLGHGGMGVVYKARQRALDRFVALKMLLAGPFAGPQELVRFHRETAALACLRHSNIVQVYDAGDVEGRPYFTMELIEGGSLAQKLSGTSQPPRQAAALVAALAEAVQVAHESGIIHRDLKPANVLLTADGTPRISDFGLARRVEGGAGLTQSGVAVGTPSYMAPEQARGQTRGIGPAVDVYALGAILYELLTGRPPFRGETPTETLLQVIHQEPVPPGRGNAAVPRDLETICLKCLHKAPARRYASARELALDLGRFLAGQPILARPVGVSERAVKWARRRPAAALLLAALVVMAGAAAAVGLWLHHQEQNRREAKAHQETQARAAIETALKRAHDRGQEQRWSEAMLIATEAATHLADADSPALEEQVRQAQWDFRAATDLERVRESSPFLADGRVDYQQRATEYQEAFERAGLRIGDDASAVADFIRASAIRDPLLAAVEDRALVAFAVGDEPLLKRLLQIAQSVDPEPGWRARFHSATAWRSRQQLLELAADAFTTSPVPAGHQLALLGCLLLRSGAESPSVQLLGEACHRQPGNFWLNREMGNALVELGRTTEAAAFYRGALALRPDNAGVHNGLGMALFHAGQSDEALAAFRRAVELSPDSRTGRQRLVGALALAGRWVEAGAECRKALDVHPTDAFPPLRLALALYQHERDEDVLAACGQAIEADPTASTAYHYRGEALLRLGRHEEAVTAFRKETELRPNNNNARHLLATELVAVGRPGEAIAEIQRGIARTRTDVVLYSDLGTLLRREGRPEEAAKAYRKAADLLSQDPAAWDGLAAALLDQGRFAEARAATARLLDLPATEAFRRTQRRQLDLCDALLPVEERLPAALAGQGPPVSARVRLALAEWCLSHARRTVAAAGFYETSLAAEPSLADDLEAGHRFRAACAAVLAGCGIGEGAARLDERRREALRQQALGWLTAEFRAWAERHRRARPGDRTAAATAVRSWQHDENLAGVRDESALARWPRDERQAWQALWADVAALAARDPAALLDRARRHVSRREWKKAVACYAEGFDLEPTDDADLWFEHAAVRLLTEDRAGYRRTCAHMLDRCQPAGPMRPYLVARACTLATGSTDNPELLGRLARNELARTPDAFWSLTEQAALQLRGSQSSNVVQLLDRSLAADGRPGRAVVSWLWLALAYQQRGSSAEARLWLERAARWLDQQGDHMPRETVDLGLHRHGWLEAHVLRQEAEALLRQLRPVPGTARR